MDLTVRLPSGAVLGEVMEWVDDHEATWRARLDRHHALGELMQMVNEEAWRKSRFITWLYEERVTNPHLGLALVRLAWAGTLHLLLAAEQCLPIDVVRTVSDRVTDLVTKQAHFHLGKYGDVNTRR